MNDSMIVECYYGYGRITIKFIEKNSLFENEWVLSEYKKRLSCIESVEKDDDEKDYGATITFEDGMVLHWKQDFDKIAGRKLWEDLVELGLKPTKETQKNLAKMGIV